LIAAKRTTKKSHERTVRHLHLEKNKSRARARALQLDHKTRATSSNQLGKRAGLSSNRRLEASLSSSCVGLRRISRAQRQLQASCFFMVGLWDTLVVA